MSQAKRCDRCNNLYEAYGYTDNINKKDELNSIITSSISDTGSSYKAIKYIDLCPNCKKSFETWLKEGLITDNKLSDIKIIKSDELDGDE